MTFHAKRPTSPLPYIRWLQFACAHQQRIFSWRNSKRTSFAMRTQYNPFNIKVGDKEEKMGGIRY